MRFDPASGTRQLVFPSRLAFLIWRSVSGAAVQSPLFWLTSAIIAISEVSGLAANGKAARYFELYPLCLSYFSPPSVSKILR